MISSSKETSSTPPTRDLHEDKFLYFNCYKFSRGIRMGRPLSRRIVSAEKCLCTGDTTEKICDRNRFYSLHFREITDEEEARTKDRITDPDIPVDRIGAFRPNDDLNFINVPTEFLNVLWNAAIAADGVLRSIQLTVQPQRDGLRWAVFEAHLKEEIAEPFELPRDKHSNPKVGPPRNNPVVAELREQLRLRWSRVGPGIITIAVGVLLALWIAKLWR